MMARFLLVLLTALSAAAPGGQEDLEARKARRAKIADLRKKLGSPLETAKIEAIQELGGIPDEEARSLLAGKLAADGEAVRIAAAKAIAKHRRPSSAQAIGAALEANARSEAVLRAFIEALVELDVCRGVSALVALSRSNNYAIAGEALQAISKVGCPEAAEGLVAFLRIAEKEEKKPDVFEDEELGTAENRNKNKPLAELAPKLRDTLAKVTGQALPDSRAWTAWVGSEKALKLTSIYLCEAAQSTFEVPSGKGRKCPYDEGKSNHTDVLLKHLRE